MRNGSKSYPEGYSKRYAEGWDLIDWHARRKAKERRDTLLTILGAALFFFVMAWGML
jgi:hypothetical protein